VVEDRFSVFTLLALFFCTDGAITSGGATTGSEVTVVVLRAFVSLSMLSRMIWSSATASPDINKTAAIVMAIRFIFFSFFSYA
jgi:hypothetical protein